MLYYRRELDGLRALAVIAVIIYHANLELFGFQVFQGGYFGVDVFFVLSGYLITGIIREQMNKGSFSFVDFYLRRAKRILPAMIAMLLVTSVFAYTILLPSDLVTYVNSLQSVLYFGSNHFFYGEDSYTAAASIYRPLLHTWSLSVEWQFYVVFPFIVWVINKYFPLYLFGSLFALALISLQFSDFVVKVDPDMAFYLLPTRAWELILGGLVTFYDRSNIESSVKGGASYFIQQSLPLLGIFLVVHSMIFIGHEVPHPSFITLIPVLGTCLFIMFSSRGELSSEILSLKPVVGIGLISYSLYLWHQPVFVFFRLLKHDYFRYEQFALLLSISLILSFVSYKYVEKSFRKTKLSFVNKLSISGGVIICIVFSLQVISNDGFASRQEIAMGFENHDLDNRKLLKLRNQFVHARDESNPSFEQVENKVLILGNSHSVDLYNALYLNDVDNSKFDFLTFQELVPQIDCFNENNSKYDEIRNSFYSSSKYLDSTTIVISTRYRNKASCRDRSSKERNTDDLDGLPFIIKRAMLDGKKVVVFGNNAEFFREGKYLPSDYVYYNNNGKEDPVDAVNRFSFVKLNNETDINREVKQIANQLGATYIDKVSLVCGTDSCLGYNDQGYKTYADTHHWTIEGARVFGKRLIDNGFLDSIR